MIIDSRQGRTFIGYTAIDEVGLVPGQCPQLSSSQTLSGSSGQSASSYALSSARRRRSINIEGDSATNNLDSLVQQFVIN